jgi:hypothetical protein
MNISEAIEILRKLKMIPKPPIIHRMYNRGDIVRFEDPWFKLSWFDKKIMKQKRDKYLITGYMNNIMGKSPYKSHGCLIFPVTSASIEYYKVSHNDLFIVEEYFQQHLVLKRFNSSDTKKYLAFFDKYVLLTDSETVQLKRNIRKEKFNKIVNGNV